jgi:hypothetical protein
MGAKCAAVLRVDQLEALDCLLDERDVCKNL